MKKNAFITAMMLKSYGLSCLNRGEDGYGKQGYYGGVNRARISSQCLKKALRKAGIFDEDNIRTTHLEDLISSILDEMVQAGQIKESDIDAYGKIICSALDCAWEKRGNQEKKPKSEEKGRTMVVTTVSEVLAVVYAATAIEPAKDKEINKAIKEALDKVRISVEKAMFGTMATSGELESVDGAVQVGQSFSIDEYRPENDFIVATFEGARVNDSDPFYGSFNDFTNDGESNGGGQTLADAWMNANVMFTPVCVNVGELKRNLSQSITYKDLDIEEKAVIEDVKDCVGNLLTELPITDPSARQNSCSTHPMPAIYYLEYIKDGNCQYADFEKAINYRPEKDGKGIAEQGIEKILRFASDNTFRKGEINRYVMLPKEYAGYKKAFEDAGVKVIESLAELKAITGEEIERMV